MEKLHAALESNNAAKMAEYFHHKRIPSRGLDQPLFASSHMATKILDRFAREFQLPTLQAILLSPTAYEAPWKAIQLATVPLAQCADRGLVEASLVAVQTFLQQVAAEWKTSKASKKKSKERPTVKPPRAWIEGMVDDILRSKAPLLLGVVSTLCALARSHDEALYKVLVKRAVAYQPLDGSHLVPWLQLLQPLADGWGGEDWVTTVQTVRSTLPQCSVESVPKALQCLVSLYRLACTKASILPQHMQEDSIWHDLVLRLYERSYTADPTRHDFVSFHRNLASSMTWLSSDLLLKWLKWTFKTSVNEPSVAVGMGWAIFRAWNISSRGTLRPKINMGPILCEELGRFLLLADSGGRDYKGSEALEFLYKMLPRTCRYKGKGIFVDQNGDQDLSQVNGAAQVLYQTINRISFDGAASKMLVNSIFDTMGNYFESITGCDLLLCTLFLVVIYESEPSVRLPLLTLLRHSFLRNYEVEASLQAYCTIVRLIFEGNPLDNTAWQWFSPVFTRQHSVKVSSALIRALIYNEAFQLELGSRAKEWITKVTPSACMMLNQNSEYGLGDFGRGLLCLRLLIVSGSAECKSDALRFVKSIFDEASSVPVLFYRQVYQMISNMVSQDTLDPKVMETLFRQISQALSRKLKDYKNVSTISGMEGLSLELFQEILLMSNVFVGIFGKARQCYDGSDLLVESMWPYDTLLDSLFAAVVEWNAPNTPSSLKCLPDERDLDVSNNDVDVANGIAALSSIYEILLGGTKVLDVKGTPESGNTRGESSEIKKGSSLGFLGNSQMTKESLLHQGRLDITRLCLAEKVWKDKPSSDYTPFVVAITSLIAPTLNLPNVDAFLPMLDPSLLSVAFGDFSASAMDVGQIDCILSIVLRTCGAMQSQINHSGVKFSSGYLTALYSATCSEEKISDLLMYLESCSEKTRDKVWLVLEPARRDSLESSVRKFRTKMILAIVECLDLAAASASPWNTNDERRKLEDFVLLLCQEFRLSLQCASGGVDADLCVAFISCIESTVCLLSVKQGSFEWDEARRLIGICRGILVSLDGILPSINLNIPDIVQSVLSLTTISVPMVAKAMFRECYNRNEMEALDDLNMIFCHSHALFERCLQKRVHPLTELPTENASLLVRFPTLNKIPVSKVVLSGHDSGDTIVSRMSLLLDNDKTSDWVFTAVLRAYRDALYYAAQHIQDPSVQFQNIESRLTFARLSFSDWNVLLQNVATLLETSRGRQKGNKPQTTMANLSSSVKDWLCAVLEQFGTTMFVATTRLNELFSNGADQMEDAGALEAFGLFLAWLRLPDDPFQSVRRWLAWEERVAARANAKQSVVVVTEAACVKDLVKVMDQVDELKPQLESLRNSLDNTPEKSAFDNRRTLSGDADNLVKALVETSFAWQDRLHARCQAWSTAAKADKTAKSNTSIPVKRRKRKHNVTTSSAARNRNQVVEEWLQKDKGTDDGKVGDDTFADLEDFIVED